MTRKIVTFGKSRMARRANPVFPNVHFVATSTNSGKHQIDPVKSGDHPARQYLLGSANNILLY